MQWIPGTSPGFPTRSGLAGLAAVLGALMLSTPALAREYSVNIRISDEQDLRELYYDGEIDDEEFQILLRMIESPIDLNHSEKADLYQLPGITALMADRIVEERIVNGPYLILNDLISRVDGTTWRLLGQIDPFVVVSMVKGNSPPVKGTIRYSMFKEWTGCAEIEDDYAARSKYRCQLGYDKFPAMGLSGGAQVLGWLDFGIAMSLQEGVKAAEYDPASRDIHASYGMPLAQLHSGYVRVRRPNGQVLVGNYNADFGSGLVMGTSSGRDRHGFTVRRLLGTGTEDRIAPAKGLFGVAARAHPLRVGRADLDLSVFGSIKNYDLYSSYMNITDGEEIDQFTEQYSSPRIWIDGKRSYSITLPNVFRVALAGGNFSVRINRRTHVGVTGYGAYLDRTLLNGVEDQGTLYIAQRWPTASSFGAIGIDGALGFGLVDFSGEASFWLDKEPAVALYFRAIVEPSWGEFVLSARHYGKGYANPFAHGEANSDQLFGYTDRNEQGVRFKALIQPNKRFKTKLRLDIARNILLDTWDFELKGSVSGRPLEFLQVKTLVRFVDQNLALSGRDKMYSGDVEEALFDTGGYRGDLQYYDAEDLEEMLDELENRAGQKVSWNSSVRIDDKKWGAATLSYQHTWTDYRKTVPVSDSNCQYRMQQGHAVRFSGRLKPHKSTTIKGSVRYYDADVQGGRAGPTSGEYGDRAVSGYLQVEQKIADVVKLRLRGGLGRRLADMPSECDQGTSSRMVPIPVSQIDYEPTEYQLRHFGHLLFSTEVKF
jgi:hypothetical protein